MRPWNNGFLSWAFICLLAGCSANRDLIILLPDPDGRTGAIQVTNKGGSQILDKPWYATQVQDFRVSPTAPHPTDEAAIKSIFEKALAALPDEERFNSFILLFESDSTELMPESKGLLPEIVKAIKNRKANEIYVVGHTDRVGTESYNTWLSFNRADCVRDLLVLSGVKRDLIFVSFYGESKPLVPTEDEVAEPRNRRVEVMVR